MKNFITLNQKITEICKGSDLVDFSSFAAKCTLNDKSVTCGENFEIGKENIIIKHSMPITNY